MAITEATLRDLRQRYNAAYTAYQSCVLALNEVSMSGKRPSPELLANEAKALHELTEARGKLLAALAEGARDDGTVFVERPDGVVIEIRRGASGGARLTVDLGCCKKSRNISCEVAREHEVSPQFKRIVREMEDELLPTCGPRPV